jgi:hypothetical protein
MCSDKKPNPGDLINNLRKPMPLGEKIKLVFSNTWIKISGLQSCCGHPGQPGC